MRMNYLMFLVCLPLHFLPGQVAFNSISLEEGLVQAGEEDKPVLLYFSASWCMPCEWMEKNTFADANNSRIINRHFVALKFDVDDPLCKGVLQKFDVPSLPTVIFLNRDGEMLLKKTSSVGVEAMFLTCRKVLDDHLKKPGLKDNAIPAPRYTLKPAEAPANPTSEILAVEEVDPQEPDFADGYSLEHLPPSPSLSDAGDFDVAPRSAYLYTLVLGRFAEFEKAVQQINDLQNVLGSDPMLSRKREEGKTTYIVSFGRYDSYESALNAMGRLKGKGIGAWVRKK